MSVVGLGLPQAANINMRASTTLSALNGRRFTGNRISNHNLNKVSAPEE